jgi:cation transport regulator ChaB
MLAGLDQAVGYGDEARGRGDDSNHVEAGPLARAGVRHERQDGDDSD